jgi:hypothetical protein
VSADTPGKDAKARAAASQDSRLQEARNKAATAAAGVQSAAGRARRAQAELEFKEETVDLFFTKDFHSAQEAIMRDRTLTPFDRVMAWLKRYSWGEQSLWAIGKDGHPRIQADCAAELGLTKSVVSRTIAFMQARGYVENRPKMLWLVIAPVLGPNPPLDEKSPEWTTFLEDWKVANSSNFAELEVARATVDKIRKIIRSDYKIWKKSQAVGTNAPATLLETAVEQSEDPASPQILSPLEADLLRRQSKPAQTVPVEEGMHVKVHLAAQAYLFAELRRMQRDFKNTSFADTPIDSESLEHQTLVNLILDALRSPEEEHLVGFIVYVETKFKGIAMRGRHGKTRAPGDETGPDTLGLLVNWARDYARAQLGPVEPAQAAVYSDEDYVRGYLHNALGEPLPTDSSAPGKLLASARKLGFTTRLLCLWVEDFAAAKRAKRYPIDSAALFLHAIETGLPEWARKNATVVEGELREEERARTREFDERRQELWTFVEKLLEGLLHGHGTLSIENDVDLEGIARLAKALDGRNIQEFEVKVVSDLKPMTNRARDALLEKFDGAKESVWLAFLLQEAAEFIGKKTKRGAVHA